MCSYSAFLPTSFIPKTLSAIYCRLAALLSGASMLDKLLIINIAMSKSLPSLPKKFIMLSMTCLASLASANLPSKSISFIAALELWAFSFVLAFLYISGVMPSICITPHFSNIPTLSNNWFLGSPNLSALTSFILPFLSVINLPLPILELPAYIGFSIAICLATSSKGMPFLTKLFPYSISFLLPLSMFSLLSYIAVANLTGFPSISRFIILRMLLASWLNVLATNSDQTPSSMVLLLLITF